MSSVIQILVNYGMKTNHFYTLVTSDDEMKPHEALKLYIRVVHTCAEASWCFICSTAPSSGQ